MNEENLRHWLAMHCPAKEAATIYNKLQWDTRGRSFEERNGVRMTLELARYIWADRMLAASCVHTIEETDE